ncbi:MAG: NAD(P)H:quinone oxidoreductase [Armatimonadota bacterium]
MKVNVLVVFYSRYGNVRALAEAVAEGAREAGADVRLRRVADLAPESVIAADARWQSARSEMAAAYSEPVDEDLIWADAILLGSPTRFGSPSAEMKLFIDKLGPMWLEGKLVDKIGSAFTSTSTLHGGNESTILAMLTPLMHLSMIIVAPGYADPAMFAGGTPYGASSVSGPTAETPPTDGDLAAARFAGRRVAERALMFKLGREKAGSAE